MAGIAKDPGQKRSTCRTHPVPDQSLVRVLDEHYR
ncbi:hypothetical protein M2366_001773 [Aeromonas sp. BIGb0405]|nr:hypothetical protein [Aeromonas sp. BIGb0405]MCS3458750.1 hypothetical protein [Aeromonas sp. BIGb0445]